MSEAESGQDKNYEASHRKLEEARKKGDVAISREGANLGLYLALLICLFFLAGPAAHSIITTFLPLIEQPEQIVDHTPASLQAAAQEVFIAVGIALAPVAGILIVASVLPIIMQNSLVASTERLRPKLSNLSPMKGAKRMFGLKALFEFAKSLIKALAVAVACWIVVRPIYGNSLALVATDPSILPGIILESMQQILIAVIVVAAVVAAIDVPFQRFEYAKRQRMTFQELKEEMKSTEGDPHIKARLKKLRRQRSKRRMLADVKTATVVVTNPTHFAVALRYDRGEDPAPICVGKGTDALALKIREVATKAGVPIIEDKPLARALYATAEEQMPIPKALYEGAARVIGLVWAKASQRTATTRTPL